MYDLNTPDYMKDNYSPTVYSYYRMDEYGKLGDRAREAARKIAEAAERKLEERKKRKEREAAEREQTSQNRFDYRLTKLIESIGKGKGKTLVESATTSEWTPVVDPTEYDLTTDPETGITTTKSGTVVFVGDPLYFDYYSEILKYKNRYGIPSNWRDLGDHWDQVPIPTNIGVGKDLRQNSALRQKWIPTSDNPNTLAKLYSINASNKAYADKMLLYARAGSKAVDLAQKTVDVASTSPMGILLKAFKWQTDVVLGTFRAQIEEANIENSLIRSTLSKKGINVDERIKELRQIADDEEWDLYDYQDLQRPVETGIQVAPDFDRPSGMPSYTPLLPEGTLPPAPSPIGIYDTPLVTPKKRSELTPILLTGIAAFGVGYLINRYLL